MFLILSLTEFRPSESKHNALYHLLTPYLPVLTQVAEEQWEDAPVSFIAKKAH